MEELIKYAVVSEPGRVEIRECSMPEPEKGDMLAKVLMAGVCGTDVHLVYSKKPFPWREPRYPFRIGHEWVGSIYAMGKEFIKEDAFGNQLKEGDRIVAYPSTWACGSCYACRILLQPNLCLRPAFRRSLPDSMSAFSEFFYIPEGSVIFKIPDSIPTEVAVLTEPMAVALRAIERAFAPGVPDRFQGMGPGKSMVVLGSGTIGVLLVILGKISGAYPIIVIGGPENRLKLCRKFGADMTICISDVPEEERVNKVTDATLRGLGADIVFEVAGVPSAFVDGIRMTRPGGTLVEVGHYTDRGTVPLNPLDICKKDIQIFGCWGYGPQQFGEALRIFESRIGDIPFSEIVTHRFPLNDLQNAIETAKEQSCVKAVIECCV